MDFQHMDFRYEGIMQDGKPVRGVHGSCSKKDATAELRAKGIFIQNLRELKGQHMDFRYEGFTQDGKPVRGVHGSCSMEDATAELRAKGIFIQNLEPAIGPAKPSVFEHSDKNAVVAKDGFIEDLLPPARQEPASAPVFSPPEVKEPWQRTLLEELEAWTKTMDFLAQWGVSSGNIPDPKSLQPLSIKTLDTIIARSIMDQVHSGPHCSDPQPTDKPCCKKKKPKKKG